MLTINDKFPDFELTALSDISFEKLNIENAFIKINQNTYKDKWKVIFFYPKDFTFVCPTELVGFANLKSEFEQRNTQILGCSIDSEFVHWAWRVYHKPLNNLNFPLLSDIKRELSNSLGILNSDGVSNRALFVVDPDNVIRSVIVTDPSVGRNPQEVIRILDALQTGELCPCSWVKGNSVIDIKNIKI